MQGECLVLLLSRSTRYRGLSYIPGITHASQVSVWSSALDWYGAGAGAGTTGAFKLVGTGTGR